MQVQTWKVALQHKQEETFLEKLNMHSRQVTYWTADKLLKIDDCNVIWIDIQGTAKVPN